MSTPAESLPTDLAAAHAMILAERQARLVAEAAVAKANTDRILLDLELASRRAFASWKRSRSYGQSSEAGARIDQFELALRGY